MSWITLNPIASFSYAFLYLSVFLLWVPDNKKIPNWSLACLISLMLGLISHQLDMIAIFLIMLLAFAAYYSQKEKVSVFVRVIAGVVLLALSSGLMTHQLPGFHNLKVLDSIYISSDAIPFTLYLNFDKTIVGIFILGFCCARISRKNEWKLLLKKLALQVPIVVLIVMLGSLVLKYVKLDCKIPDSIFIWFITNLLFVCMAEEAFFRGLIQKNLSVMMKKIKYGNYFALFITAILFGLVHYVGGIRYVMLATVAGIGYGWVYLSTKRIEGSILTHFAVNLTHILFFTYPALASAI